VVATPFWVLAGETEPHGVGEQEIDQFTPALVKSLTILAEKWAVPSGSTEETSDETLI
jgi:hypothetical protein